MKQQPSYATRIGTVALAAQMLIAACIPAAFAQESAPPPRRGEPITLNFNNAEIESVARTMAVVTGRDVVVDPRVKGTMNLQTDRPISPAAAFNQFAAALRLQGFAVVQSEGLYKVVPEADAKLQSSAVTTSTPATSSLSGNQIVTQVFKLNYESANNLLPVLRPLIAPNNTINVNPGNNSLVITDYAENMRRLARIVAALDVPNASDIEVIPLKHSVATDLVPVLTRLVEGGSSTGPLQGAAPGTVDASFRTTMLAEPRSNAVILRAANPARSQLIRTLIDRLDRAPIDNGNGAAGNIYVVYLKNADAIRLATTLRAALASSQQGAGGTLGQAGGGALSAAGGTAPTPQSQSFNQQSSSAQGGSSASTAPISGNPQPSTGGQIQADPSTNSLIISAPEPLYRQLRAVIDRLDSRRAQVLIESLIVEVNADKAAEFGIQWQTGIGNSGDRNVGVLGTNSSLGGANIIDLALGLATGNAATRPSSGINFGIGHRYGNGNYVLGFLARFLASNGEGNVLSTPNLLTLDNEEAKIVVGQNVPFVTGQYTNTGSNTNTVNPFQTIERKDVGLTLRVRPQISETGTVKMAIFQEVSSVVASTTNNVNGPTTSKRSIESNVLVDDGNIIVLGGLLSDEYSTSEEKVPGLGDVPVLGNLFKSEVRSRRKTNLMVFLRPTIVRDQLSSDAVTADRYDSLRAMQQATQPSTDNPMLNAVRESPVLPPLPETMRGDPSRRIEGTRLIPPPLPPQHAPLPPGPMKGALPPTADPSTARELP